jgi:putative nucleotidyltransferase with HDIG domain
MAPPRAPDLIGAIAEFGLIPAFGPACEQAIAAVAGWGANGPAPLVNVIERDIGLTVAVLRRAQTHGSTRPIANVADAVANLSADEIATAIGSLPRAAFPWHTRFEALLLGCQIHSQAVARAAERLAQMTRPFDTEDVVAAALLHDIGKLLLARARPGYVAPTAARCTPAERARAEQRELGIDHASLGGLMLERWGFPEGLVGAVARHHSPGPASETAALVRLADMIAHHANGDAVDRAAMMRLADDCGLPVDAVRDAVFDQPRASATTRRRAARSPLSDRETTVLRLVADGRRNAHIAQELNMSVSTVRSHLHNINGKLDVRSPAQAVVRASEMAWL